MVHAWTPDVFDSFESLVRLDSYPWNRWVRVLIRCLKSVLTETQIHCVVLLCRSILQHILYREKDHDSHQSPRIYDLHHLSLYATSPTATRIRFPRQRRTQQRRKRLDEREIRKLPRGDAVHAFRVLVLHRMHHVVPRGNHAQVTRAGRDSEVEAVAALLSPPRHWVSLLDSYYDCRDR